MTQEFKPQDHTDFVGGWVWTELEIRWIKERIEKAVLDEREACAMLAQKTVCDTHIPTGVKIYGTAAAKAIRARSEA